MRRIAGVLAGLVLGAALWSPVIAATGASFEKRLAEPKYVTLLNELQTKYKFSREDLTALFSQAKFLPQVPEKFAKPAELLPYTQYRPIFLTPENIEQGRAYLTGHAELLQSIEARYGVDRAALVAILGVETRFGKRTDGGYLVFDALNTIFTGVPDRESFARKELIEFLLLCREEKLDPLSVKGSYAGAMGNAQFIPSSYRAYAVDFDGDGKRNLWSSDADTLASIANYLKLHGWRKGAPTRLPITLDGTRPALRTLLDQGAQGKTTLAQLVTAGASWDGTPAPPAGVDAAQEISLLAYPSDTGEKTVMLFPNFKAILTYNRAANYALAVSDLADQISQP